jgi:hypothetical protein
VIAEASGGATASLEFYESTNDDGVDQGTLFDTFTPGAHGGAFNAADSLWGYSSNTPYPYAGKSNVGRGSGGGEGGAIAPLGALDLQLHPPQNNHLVVAAFIAPANGDYTVTGLAARRPHFEGENIRLKLFAPSKTLQADVLASNNQDWAFNNGPHDLGTLVAGDRIYFGVNREGDFGWDAAEIAFTITHTP